MSWRFAGALLCLLPAASAGAQEQKALKEAVPVFDKAYLSNKKNIATGRAVWEG